jgi:hypothetical protein
MSDLLVTQYLGADLEMLFKVGGLLGGFCLQFGPSAMATATAAIFYYFGGTVFKAWEFLSDLFNKEAQQKRLGRLASLQKEHGINFETYVYSCMIFDNMLTTNRFYVSVTKFPFSASEPGHFIQVPESGTPVARYFSSITNDLAADWFVGHMGMFCAKTNGNHNWLVLRTALFISEAVSTFSELKA